MNSVIDAPAEPRSLHYLTPAVPVDRIKDNIRAAIARGLPLATVCKPHGMLMSIAGGGPSIADTYRDLVGVRAAINGSLKWLIDQGLRPHIAGICDPGAHIAGMLVADPDVRYYVASSCDPAVFDKLRGCDVRLWHVTPASTEDPDGVTAILNDAYPDHWHAIGGGCTMGLRWLDLGYFLGFRRFNLHGLDSSFRGTATHAYPDRADDKDRITYEGRETRPNFLAQVYDFFGVLNRLKTQDPIEIEVFGDGLLQDEWLRWLLRADPLAFTRYPKSYVWPEGDEYQALRLTECRLLMAQLLPHVLGRGVAVQAGGNVGVLPAMLGCHFARVHTFEPDPASLACLVRNTTGTNVTAYAAALGDREDRISLKTMVGNSGATCVNGGGDIPMRRLDGFDLDGCDLLCLDIEGLEFPALQGAEATIDRFSPIIVIEEKGLSERYGIPQGAAIDWLGRLGYGIVGSAGHDLILKRAGKSG